MKNLHNLVKELTHLKMFSSTQIDDNTFIFDSLTLSNDNGKETIPLSRYFINKVSVIGSADKYLYPDGFKGGDLETALNISISKLLLFIDSKASKGKEITLRIQTDGLLKILTWRFNGEIWEECPVYQVSMPIQIKDVKEEALTEEEVYGNRNIIDRTFRGAQSLCKGLVRNVSNWVTKINFN